MVVGPTGGLRAAMGRGREYVQLSGHLGGRYSWQDGRDGSGRVGRRTRYTVARKGRGLESRFSLWARMLLLEKRTPGSSHQTQERGEAWPVLAPRSIYGLTGQSSFLADFSVCPRQHAFDILERRCELPIVAEAAFVGHRVEGFVTRSDQLFCPFDPMPCNDAFERRA